jgi:hypothetical protein
MELFPDFTLIGRGLDYLPHFIRVVDAMGQACFTPEDCRNSASAPIPLKIMPAPFPSLSELTCRRNALLPFALLWSSSLRCQLVSTF